MVNKFFKNYPINCLIIKKLNFLLADEDRIEIIQEIPRIDSKIPKILEKKKKFCSFFSKIGRNILNHLFTFLLHASYIWRWFGNLQIIKRDLEIENKYISGNNYLYETSK